jgi:hypothetical protein
MHIMDNLQSTVNQQETGAAPADTSKETENIPVVKAGNAGKPGRAGTLLLAVNRPWLLVAVPLLVAGFWLVLNPAIITNNIDKPYALLAGPSLAGSVLAGWLLIRFFAVLAGWWASVYKKLFTRAGFFWTVIACFMAVSVWQGGAFFSISGDLMGFSVALFLDLVTVVLMHAQLESRYRGENGRANLFILFISLTCGMSCYANLAMALNTFKAAVMLPNAPEWVQGFAPYALASSPLFVIMMSIAAEMIVNIRPLDKLNEKEYEGDEKKRINLLEIRNRYYEKQVDAALALQTIKAKHRASRSRGWLLRLPWVRRLDVDFVVSEAAKKLDERFTKITEQNTQLATSIQALQGIDVPGLVRASVDPLALSLAQYNQQFTSQLQALQQVDVTGLVVGAVDPLASKVLALAELSQQVSSQLQALQGQVKPLDTVALVEGITRQLDAVYSAKFEALTRHNEDLSMQVSALLAEIQEGDSLGDTEELTSVVTPYSAELMADIQSLLTRYPILERWASAGRRSVTIEEIQEVTGHSRKMVVNRVNDHTIKRTRKAGKYRVDSVIDWLKVAPLPRSNRDKSGRLEAVQPGTNGHSKDTIKLDEFEPVGV